MAEEFPFLPPLREVIAQYGLRAEKSLGQNFLLDQNITDKIVRYAGDLSGACVFEIGPGPGGLTRSLLKSQAVQVIAIEFDDRAVEALQPLIAIFGERLKVIKADALEVSLLTLAPSTPRVIVANLPYNIATVLFLGWLKEIREYPQAYDQMILMFQKEVAERLTAAVSTKAYGRLSVITQWLCQPQKLFDLPPSAFTPAPKVVSRVVKFTPREGTQDRPRFSTMEVLTAQAFGQRRKMIRTSLKSYLSQIEARNIDPQKRAEDLTVAEYIALAQDVERTHST